ncbi:MAG: hypothetical protein Q7V57_03080 [Actinomycetota bacterium]|nr:hypothetical protein [Actinomycetota bacterium]
MIARQIEVVDGFEAADRCDREFWWSRTPHERLLALQQMRVLNYGTDRATARLQRVLEVVERPRR